MTSRVVLETAELHELAELTEFTARRVQAIRRLLAELRPGLLLTNHAAPDEAASTALSAALDACTALLTPLGTAAAGDLDHVTEVRRRALAADDGPRRRLPRADVERLLASVGPTTPPAQLAVLEALLLGGLRRTPVSAKHRASHPRPPVTPATAAPSAAVRAVVRVAKTQLDVAERVQILSGPGRESRTFDLLFVSWVFARSGQKLPSGFTGVRQGAEAMQRRGQLHQTPQVGDVWLHRGPTTDKDRAGVVVAVGADGSFTTIGGSEDNDAVREVRHARGELAGGYGFGRTFPG